MGRVEVLGSYEAACELIEQSQQAWQENVGHTTVHRLIHPGRGEVTLHLPAAGDPYIVK